jgi:membrane protease YdiL (CAAX protease family)
LSAADRDRPAERTPRWGLGDVLAGLVVAIVTSSVVGAIALGATGDDDLDELPMWLYSVVQAAQYVGFVGVPVLATRLKGNGVVRDLGVRMTRRDVPLGLALGVGLQLLVVPLVSYPWVWILGRDANELDDRARELTDRAHGFGLFVLSLVLVVGAPFAEELFFRGLTLRSFERRMGVWLGLVVTAALFAATHLDLLSLPALFVFGLVVGYLVQRTGRLGPAWWTHVGFNATTVVVLVATR